MSSRAFLTATVAAAALKTVQGAGDDHSYTKLGFANGRIWLGADFQSRLGLVSEIADGGGWALLAAIEANEAFRKPIITLMETLDAENTIGELSEGVTDFYRDPVNIRVAIVDAWAVFIARSNGVPIAKIETRIAALRRAEQ